MDPETGERFERVEAHLMQVEHLVEQLNDVVLGQGKELERLKLQVRRQAQTLEAIEMDRVRNTDPKPPHH